MLDALKFVKGVIDKKSLLSDLSCFHIKDRTIKAYNGYMCLSSHIDLDIEAAPDAATFVKAIETCEKETAIHLTDNNKLHVKSGNFEVFINCVENKYDALNPEGKFIELNGEFLKSLKIMMPFIAKDETHPFARGVLFRDQSLIATNNVILIEHWIPFIFPVSINVPELTVKELIRIGEEPHTLQVSENSITFHYKDERWLRSNLLSTDWPSIDAVLRHQSNQRKVTKSFFSVLKKIQPFATNYDEIYFDGKYVKTSEHDDEGANFSLYNLRGKGCYNVKELLKLEGVAKTIDFDLYPDPCIFYGDNIRGAIVGKHSKEAQEAQKVNHAEIPGAPVAPPAPPLPPSVYIPDMIDDDEIPF